MNILTPEEAANFVRTEATDAVLLQLLPLVDQHLLNATGHDWSADTQIYPTAKIAAGMTLVYWYDNPGALGQSPEALTNQLIQLEAEAMKYRKYHFEGASGAGSVCLAGAREGDVVLSLTGVYGLSGDQSTLFESSVSEENYLVQTSASDLSEKQFVAVLKHPADDVKA